jgi:thiamine kinase-like enzyme
VARLRAAHERVLGEIAAAGDEHLVVLHGDAHVGNLLAAGTALTAGTVLTTGTVGWVWTDLEETSRGPAAWDLATLASRYDAGGAREALAAYAAQAGTPLPSPESLATFRRARDLEATAWLLCMAHLYPERYAIPAQQQLRALVS